MTTAILLWGCPWHFVVAIGEVGYNDKIKNSIESHLV